MDQLPAGFERDAPTKGTAKADPALLEQLNVLEPEVNKARMAAEGAKFQLRLAEKALKNAQQLAFVRIQSQRNVQKAREFAGSYIVDDETTRDEIDAARAKHLKQLKEAKEKEAKEKLRRQRERAAMSWDTNVDAFSQGWRSSWGSGHAFPKLERFPPTKWLPPPPPPESEPEALTALKKHLGQNLGRVTELFKTWDVDCDHTVSVDELRNALGALKVPFDEITLAALFRDIDVDQSGSLDFEELHKALRKDAPKRVPANYISLSLPKRKEPNPLGTGAERRAVAALKRALHTNLDRTTDLFHKMDYDGDGLISKQELRRAMAAQCIEVDTVALDMLFSKLDSDESGGIDFKELHGLLRREFVFTDDLAEARQIPVKGCHGSSGFAGGMSTSASVPALGDRARTVPAGAIRGGTRSRAQSRANTSGPSRRLLYEQKLVRHDMSVVKHIFQEREAEDKSRGLTMSKTEPKLVIRS